MSALPDTLSAVRSDALDASDMLHLAAQDYTPPERRAALLAQAMSMLRLAVEGLSEALGQDRAA